MRVKSSIVCIVGLAVLFCKGPLPDAASDYNEQASAKAVSHYLMGLIHDWNGETDEAISQYMKAHDIDPTSYAIHIKLGGDYAHLGKIKESIAELNKAVALNPRELQAHYLLALVYSSQQNFDKAAGEYEIILQHFSKVDPHNVEILNYLGQLYYSQRNYNKAIAQFKSILDIESKNADVMFMLGSVYLDMNNRSSAMEYFKKTVATDPRHEGGLNSLGYMYAEDGINLDEALNLVNKALELSPDNGAYLDSLGWVYYKKGMYQKALDSLMKAVTLYKDPLIYEHIGDVYYKMNQNGDAEKYWRQSLSIAPDQPQVLDKLSSIKKNKTN